MEFSVICHFLVPDQHIDPKKKVKVQIGPRDFTTTVALLGIVRLAGMSWGMARIIRIGGWDFSRF